MSHKPVRAGRPFFRFCVAAALLVVGGAIFAAWDAILERWYLHRLDSPELEVRRHAIERLGETGSRRAVPRLIEIAGADGDLGPRAVAALVRGRDEAPPELLSLLKTKPAEYLLRSVAAIDRDGLSPAGTSALLTVALQGPEDVQTSVFHFQYLGRVLEKAGTELVPELIQALENGDEIVRRRAFSLLKHPVDARVMPVLCNLL